MRAVPLLRASMLPVRQPPVLAPAGAALVLPWVMVGMLDGPGALTILRWTGVLLACVLVAAVDDPSGEVLSSSPYPRAARVGARVAVAAVVATPVWGVAGLLVQWRQPGFPVLPVALEALGLAAVGVALAAGLRAWRDLDRPSHLAALLLLAVVAAVEALPRWYVLTVQQTWGPPWHAAHVRWVAVGLFAAAFVAAAVREPLRRSR